MNKYDCLRLENQMCFPLYVVSKEIVKKYTPFLNELDLTYTQYITMMVLWQQKEISVRDLGKQLFLDSGTMTPVLKALEKKGYITRERSKEDERLLIVSITDSGMRLRDKAVDIPAKVGGCISMDEKEALQFYNTLHKIMGQL